MAGFSLKRGFGALRARFCCEKGLSLIAMAFLTTVIGLLAVGGVRIYESWDKYRSAAETEEAIKDIQGTMQQYFALHGRYPCPASLVAAIDEPEYGVEVSNDCTAGEIDGTFRAQGRDGRWVRTGAVPVRTLNMPATYSHDTYRQRFIYAVTEIYAVEGAPVDGEQGAIEIVDGAGNNATAIPGNVVELVYSMGWDPNGAYSINGVNLAACDPAARSGENCDFDDDAVFMNTLNKSTRAESLFVHNMSYVPNRHIVSCEEAGAGKERPRNTSFLVDTSGSMAYAGKGSDGFEVMCPGNMPGCSRIDVARWAMRRVIPAHIHSNNIGEEPGQTGLTGFVGYDNITKVEKKMGDITFDDPSAPGYTPPDDATVLDNLEKKLQGMCPNNSTPLGLHMQALADRLRTQTLSDIAGGGDPKRPSKITVISDGLSNNGTDPVTVAKMIAAMRSENPPVYIQVDIIDPVGNPSLMQISQLTGGKYYRTDNPDALLDALYDSAGICSSYTPATPIDQNGCGSKGGWWK